MSIEGRPETSLERVPLVRFALISPDSFRTFGITVRGGRPFGVEDQGNSQPVAIINETLARQFCPSENPIGKTIWMGVPENLLSAEAQLPENRPSRRTIVGVVGDVKGGSLNQPSSAQVYVPLTQHRREGWSNSLLLAVQSSVPPETLTSAIKDQIRGLDPDQPVSSVRTLDDLLGRTLSEARFSLMLFSLFAVLGLVLAAIGIYGVMATTVSQRTHEMGLRMALGAQKRDVLRLIIGHGMISVFIGVGVGLAFAFGLTRLMSSLLFEVSPTDPATLVVITLLLAVVALLACYLPARRAARVDPMVALRNE